jgi:hypothetical protein
LALIGPAQKRKTNPTIATDRARNNTFLAAQSPRRAAKTCSWQDRAAYSIEMSYVFDADMRGGGARPGIGRVAPGLAAPGDQSAGRY